MLLEIQNLTVTFTRRNQSISAVENVSLKIQTGEIKGLVGESGCGKSTLALSILGLLPPSHAKITSGEILWGGKNLSSLSEKELNGIRGKEISFIFQEPFAHLNPIISLGQQVAEPLLIHDKAPLSKVLPKVQSLFSELGISDSFSRLSQFPFEMSGGQLQRVLTATALITKPQLILADEPTTAIDPSSQKNLLEMFKALREKDGTGFLIITHDLPMIASIADTLAVMYCGRLVEEGPTEALLSGPLHPYTQGLLDTVETPGQWIKLKTIEGDVPDPANKPTGCAFHPRCHKASALCKNKIPEWREYKPKHFAACFHTS